MLLCISFSVSLFGIVHKSSTNMSAYVCALPGDMDCWVSQMRAYIRMRVYDIRIYICMYMCIYCICTYACIRHSHIRMYVHVYIPHTHICACGHGEQL